MHNPFPNPPLIGLGLRFEPLQAQHLDELYAVACDPLIWEQHPAKNRHERIVFEAFFLEAMEMGGAYIIFDDQTQQCLGSTRFYRWQPHQKKVVFGYTFLGRPAWGNGTNLRLKRLGLAHAFQHVEQVDWELHASNLRSKMALQKLGLKQAEGEEDPSRLRFSLTRKEWLNHFLYFSLLESDAS
jgi:RimJ/RimL family protein N-acetyltransferase